MSITTFSRQFTAMAGLLVALGAASQAHAQAQEPGSGGPTPQQAPDPTAVPIDGGASLLLAGSVAYGLRKLRQRRKQ